VESQTDFAACKENTITSIFVKFSLLLLQLSKSVVQCSREGNFHLVLKAVFLNFLASLSFALFAFLLAPYPSNTTQMSLTHIYHTPVTLIHLYDIPIAQMLMMHYMSSTFCRSDIPQKSTS